MYDVNDSLLPKTATPLAQAMDILEERLFNLPVEMITKDPWLVDVRLLDHLAWEHSVDAWDSGWSENVKRTVVAASAEVHRYKGTPHGIRTALKSFGVDVELVEWFEQGGSGVRGTFVARAFVTDPLDGAEELIVTAPVVSAMKSVLDSVSPVSRGWSLESGVSAEAPRFMGVFPEALITVVAGFDVEPPPVSIAAASIAVVPITKITSVAATG